MIMSVHIIGDQNQAWYKFLSSGGRNQDIMDLHNASNKKDIIKLLKEDKADINALNDIGDAPLHTLVRNAIHDKKGFEILWNFLVYCDGRKFDINIRSKQEGNSALHLAAEKNDLDVVRALVVFDADVNCLNHLKMSPMDYTMINNNQEMAEFLQTRGAYDGPTLRKSVRGEDSIDAMPVRLESSNGLSSLKISDPVASISSTISSGETPLELSIHDGQRILCLDGGGLKGLILIEVLIYIEQYTGKKIVELFDWIVGASTGGIIALALVYAKKTLQDLKQLFFQLKDDVFATAKMGDYGCDSKKFSEVFKEYFGEEIRMHSVSEPKVMIPAVDCGKTDLNLVFFNNCFFQDGAEQKYTNELVWKVARYTSSAPVYFEPEDGYIDGGIKANNPTDFAMTRIQKFYDIHDEVTKTTTKYACVVSVGCGIFRPHELGDFSIQKHFTSVGSFFQFYKIFGELKNLLNLLGNAISNEEEVAESCRLRFEKQGIPFYRFSPSFNDSKDVQVPASETDAIKLCQLIIRAQDCLTTAWNVQIRRLASLLERVGKSRIQTHGFKY